MDDDDDGGMMPASEIFDRTAGRTNGGEDGLRLHIAASTAGETPSSDQKATESQATKIVRDVVERDQTRLWHTPTGDGYLTLRVGCHWEHHSVRSGACRDYLSRVYFQRARTAANSSAIADAQNTLAALARFEGETHPVSVRVAECEGRIYLDLADANWRVVEVDGDGWRVISDPPVRFRRPRGLQALPEPVRGGAIADLATFLNLSTEDDFRLCVAWALAALRGRGPYPILLLTAEQGSAKSTTTKVLRRLVDPNDADTRRPPRNTEHLMIAAANSHVVAFDNLSSLSEELSDNLSALATGSGFSVRQLYSNDEEHITYACRPIILNGISQFATRGDVLDRALALTLPPIADSHRRDEDTFWRDFAAIHPRLLGAVLDAVAIGLRRWPEVQLPRLPRMADFVRWSVAVEPGCPWPAGRFLAGYSRNRSTSVAVLLEGDPVAEVVKVLAEPGWVGTATALLAEVNARTPEDVKRRREWFASPKQLSDHLRRILPALRKQGIRVTAKRRMKARLIHISRGRGTQPGPRTRPEDTGPAASSASSPSPDPPKLFDGDAHDADDAGAQHFSGPVKEEDEL